MHIPDNYLSPSTCAVMGAAMIPVWTVSVRRVKKEISNARVPLLGIGAAFTFLLMMFNVPLPGGTTGHAVGGTLLAILLGPWSACIALTVSLLLQALLFGDGGILAFGANCFNMAFVLPFAGYLIYRIIRERLHSSAGDYTAVAVGSYAGIVLASLCTAVEFGIQPMLFHDAAGHALYCPYPLAISIPAMVIPHMAVAGIVEAAFTVSIVAFIHRVSPGLIYERGEKKLGPVYMLIAALVILSPLGLLASGSAWGEWSADEIGRVGGEKLGYVPKAIMNGFTFKVPAPEYVFSGLPKQAGYLLSAAAGAAVLIIAFKLAAYLLKRKYGAEG
jgi:cobalt/nickel transport system permease protein